MLILAVIIFLMIIYVIVMNKLIYMLIYNKGIVPSYGDIEGKKKENLINFSEGKNIGIDILKGENYNVIVVINNKQTNAIAFYHGNAMNNYDDLKNWFNILKENKLNGVFIECPGKNGIKNIYTKENLLKTIDASLNAIKDKGLNIQYTIGYSLGSYAAIQTAIKLKNEKLVLIAPFNNFVNNVLEKLPKLFFIERWIVKRICKKYFDFDNISKLREYNSQVFLFHGGKDDVIKSSNSVDIKKEFSNVKEDKIFYELLDEADHVTISNEKNLKKIFKKSILLN
ncbi:hypothetical protein A0H76_2917 [Hepatospora eriocheir]|uniref:Serine aminopeptidase S33 domain-containing protein n=1 Tax=Hepatospora eriocheir TaxID=1081669 RepID=A0A1X0Q5J0_9MICR|nr:hypothetical protein A0H76_2917 [Hepatospora eriocheir]